MKRRSAAALLPRLECWRPAICALLWDCSLAGPALVGTSALAPVTGAREFSMQDLTASVEYLADSGGLVSVADPWSSESLWRALEGRFRFDQRSRPGPDLWLRLPVRIPPGEPFDR